MTNVTENQPTSAEISSELPKRRIRPLSSVWNHKLLVCVLFTIITGVGAKFILSSPPVYRAEAVLEVLPNYIGNLKQDRELDFVRSRGFITTQLHAIENHDVLLDATLSLKNVDKSAISVTPEDHELADKLKRTVSVKQISGTYRLVVSTEGKKPEGLAATVNAVVKAYQKKMVKNKFIGKDIRIKNLTERKIELQAELRALVAHKDRLIEELGVPLYGDQLENPYEQVLSGAMLALTEAHRNRLQLENNLAIVETKKERINNNEIADLQVTGDMLDNDETYRALSNRLKDRLTTIKTQLAELSPTHPIRSSLEEKVAGIESQLVEEKKAAEEQIIATYRRDRMAKLEFERIDLMEKIEEAHFLEKRIAAEMKEHKNKLTRFSGMYTEYLDLRDKINRVRNQINAIEDRLDFFELEENAPGFVNIVSLARPPEKPLQGKEKKLFIALVFAAFFVSCGTAIAFDYFNPWVKSPADIELTLRYPPVGWIPLQNSKRYNAFAADQLRRLALAIHRQHIDGGKKCFALTSVKQRGGTTKLTLELTQQLTTLGIKALAVEINTLKPDSVYSGNRTNSIGLTSFLTKNISIDQVVEPETDSLPARIPFGNTQGNGNLTVNSEIFSLLRNTDYDIILFDTPPILLSSDTELFSRFVDATLLIVEAGAVTQGELKRAAKLLDQVSPSMFAVILNRVRIQWSWGSYFFKLMKEYEIGAKQPCLQNHPEPSPNSKENSDITYFRMVIHDAKDKPHAQKDYELTIDGKSYYGKTNLDGLVEECVPASAKKGTLRLVHSKNGTIHYNGAKWNITFEKSKKNHIG